MFDLQRGRLEIRFSLKCGRRFAARLGTTGEPDGHRPGPRRQLLSQFPRLLEPPAADGRGALPALRTGAKKRKKRRTLFFVPPGSRGTEPDVASFYRVLPSFTEFCGIIPSVTEFYLVFTQFYLVLPSFT